MNEEEYWRYYEAVASDVLKAAYCYYASREINAYAAASTENLDRVNRHATFWKTTMYGLQIGWFMALSRLFDESSETHNMVSFLGYTVRHPEFFTRDAFVARRVKENGGVRPEYLDGYEIRVPSMDDLRTLAGRLRPFRQKWTDDQRAIRDEVFAHTIATDQGRIAAMFSRTLVEDVEDMTQGLRDILGMVRQLWSNGRDPAQYVSDTRFVDALVAETHAILGG
jgi:hypothetical protein